MQNTDTNVQTTYNLAFPNDNKIGVTEFISCEDNIWKQHAQGGFPLPIVLRAFEINKKLFSELAISTPSGTTWQRNKFLKLTGCDWFP